MKPVGIWIRVSTQDQAEGDSPRNHENRARHYAAAKDFQVVTVYDLSGVSGKNVIEHPEAQRMLADVRSGKITGLIFSKLARLARNTEQLIQFSKIFREHKASLVSLGESIDTETAAGRMFYTIIGAVAEFEREEIVSRVTAGLDATFARGQLTGTVPYGWRAVDTGRINNRGKPVCQLEAHPEERRWIRQMNQWRRAGWAYNKIAKELNRLGVPTKRSGEIVGYKHQTRIARSTWQCGNVARVLQNRYTRKWLDTERREAQAA